MRLILPLLWSLTAGCTSAALKSTPAPTPPIGAGDTAQKPVGVTPEDKSAPGTSKPPVTTTDSSGSTLPSDTHASSTSTDSPTTTTTGVTPTDTPPTGVTPGDTTTTGVTPPDEPPPGVTPPDEPPPGVTPPDEPPGVTPPGLLFPAACLTNMIEGHHVTDYGYVAKLTDKQGKVLAAAPMSLTALTHGHSCSSQGPSACYVLSIDLTYADDKLASGEQEGLLSLCQAKDPAGKPEAATCVDLAAATGYDPKNDENRVFQYINLPVTFSAKQGQIEVTHYAGMPGDPNGENILLVYHPAMAFAAPGACEKDFTSPLVLDLDHDGQVGLTNVWSSGPEVRFDWSGKGQKTRTGWVKSGDGFLVLDQGGQGKINDGTALFGEYTQLDQAHKRAGKSFANGFAALAQIDSNHDGKIDRQDARFSELKVWRDLNQDGVVQPAELASLDAAGIVELTLAYQKVPAKERLGTDGNETWFRSAYRTKDGKSYPVADVWFKQRQGVEIAPPHAALAKVKGGVKP